VPEKYQVKNEDGTINWEASALKQAQGYAALAQRMGAGEAPPKDPDGYAPELPQGVTLDALKSDPLYAGFLKGAHAKGLNNAQVGWLLGQFQERMAMATAGPDPTVAEAELAGIWKLPGEMDKNLSNSYRAAHAFAADKEHAARLEQKFGNDPDFIRGHQQRGAGNAGEPNAPSGLPRQDPRRALGDRGEGSRAVREEVPRPGVSRDWSGFLPRAGQTVRAAPPGLAAGYRASTARQRAKRQATAAVIAARKDTRTRA